MSILPYRHEKMQVVAKNVTRDEYVKSVCSRIPLNLYAHSGSVCRYPDTERMGLITDEILPEGVSLREEMIAGESVFSLFEALWIDTLKPMTTKDIAWENCTYADGVYGAKNAYLSFSVGDSSENILYSWFVMSDSKDVLSSINVLNGCAVVYKSLSLSNSYYVFYSQYCTDSNNLWFCYDLLGCSECIACYQLQNQSYCINNKQYTKEEYYIIKKQLLDQKENFEERYEQLPKDQSSIIASENVTGRGIVKSSQIDGGYMVNTTTNSKNVIMTNDVSEVYNGIDVGLNTHDIYGAAGSGESSSHNYCVVWCGTCVNIYYCYHIVNCSYCFGCIGLKNKSFCIFNKQYTKEDWFMEVNRLFETMEKEGTLGHFFPGALNPFYFNDTAAFVLEKGYTKDTLCNEGYMRRDEKITVDIPEGLEKISVSSLGEYEGVRDGKWYIDPTIMDKIIEDNDGNIYRIVKMEYDFLLKHGLPLPKEHRLERLRV